nr:hypothetical protein [Actinospica durhamensis]
MIAVAVAVIIGVVAVTCGIVADSNHPDSLAFLGVMVRTTAAQIFLAGAICTWALFAALWLLSAGIHRSRERGIELRALRAAAAGVDSDDLDDLDDLDLDAGPGFDPVLNPADRAAPANPADPRLDRGRAGAGAGATPWTGTASGTGAGTGAGSGPGVGHEYGCEQPGTNHGWPGYEGWEGRPNSNWDWPRDGDWDGRPDLNPDWQRNQFGQTGTNPASHENRHGHPYPNPDSPRNQHGQAGTSPDWREDPYGHPDLDPHSPRNQHGQTGTSPDWREDGNWGWDLEGHSDKSQGQRGDEGARGDGRGPGPGTESWENADWPNRAASVAQTPSPDTCGPTGSSYRAVPIRSEPDVPGSPNTAPGTGFASYAFPGFDSYRSSAFATSPVSDQTTSDSIPPTSERPESDHPASDSSGPVQPGADSIRSVSGTGSVGTGFSDGTSPAAGLDGVDPRRARKPVSE